jgi:hypothetical protein
MALSKFSWTGYWLKDEVDKDEVDKDEVEEVEDQNQEDPQPFTLWAIATTAEEARKILLDILYFTLAVMIPIDDVDKVIVRELTHQYFRNHMLYGKSESPHGRKFKHMK